MLFKYFENPEVITGLRKNKTQCDTCKKEKFCFDAEAYYGGSNLSSVCPECLANGELYDLNVFTCEGDAEELKRQLKITEPALTGSQIEELAGQKTKELEKTTPKIISWQDWSWPCADGDYCRFIGYGSRPFYNRLAPDGNGKRIFADSFYYSVKDVSDEGLWDELLPDEEVKDYEDSSSYSVLFYVFKSLNSDKIITIWDCD
ncbi:MAG: hypothetical protein JWO09_3723 [Bacteroidetes bacterium]|nr:hypothetical protein [Bacteroidota bacterium]